MLPGDAARPEPGQITPQGFGPAHPGRWISANVLYESADLSRHGRFDCLEIAKVIQGL
jgi:hypothetical protein